MTKNDSAAYLIINSNIIGEKHSKVYMILCVYGCCTAYETGLRVGWKILSNHTIGETLRAVTFIPFNLKGCRKTCQEYF